MKRVSLILLNLFQYIILYIFFLHQPHILEASDPSLNEGPDFFILGGVKCGTTSLFYYLKEHPNIQLPQKKELRFFNTLWKQNNHTEAIQCYLEQFPKKNRCHDFFLTGEASPSYLIRAQPKEVSRYFPQAKLIILLRNPIEYALSHYKMRLRKGEEKDTRTIEEIFTKTIEDLQSSPVTDNDSYIYKGIYVPLIQRWREFYPDNQIFIICSEDFFANPRKIMNDVFTFLGLSAFDLKEYKIFNKGLNSEITLSPDLRKQMSEFYAPYNQELQTLLKDEMHIDIDLASFGWDVGPETNTKKASNLEGEK